MQRHLLRTVQPRRHAGPDVRWAERHGQLDIYANYSVLPLLRCLAGFTVGIVAHGVAGFALGVTMPAARTGLRTLDSPE